MRRFWFGLAFFTGVLSVGCRADGISLPLFGGQRLVIEGRSLVRFKPICDDFPYDYLPYYRYEIVKVDALIAWCWLTFGISFALYLSYRGQFGMCRRCDHPILFLGGRCINCLGKREP